MEWFPILIKTVLLPMFVFYCTYRILSICVLLSWCCTAAGTLKFCQSVYQSIYKQKPWLCVYRDSDSVLRLQHNRGKYSTKVSF